LKVHKKQLTNGNRKEHKKAKTNTSLTTEKLNLDILLTPQCIERKPGRWKLLENTANET
jgi:hypothetical protein